MRARDIFGLEGLADLGSRNGVDMRPTLLCVLTDLYVHRLTHTPGEERHYTELALRLLEAVDLPTRVAVARRFARYLSPPLRVLQWLSRDLPEVAAELRPHPLLQPSAPAEMPPEKLVVTPAAKSVATPTTEAKANEQDRRTAQLHRTIDRAKAAELNDFFFAANAEERRLIVLNLNVVAPVAAGRGLATHDPSIVRRLEAAALTANRDDFAHDLARALYIPREQARRIVLDQLGEPVVVATKTLGMARDVLYRVLMFLNPAVGHSVERVHALARLYDEMTSPAADGMLAIWQALQPNESAAAKYRPLAYDDETHRRARPEMPVQRTPAAARPEQRRNAS